MKAVGLRSVVSVGVALLVSLVVLCPRGTAHATVAQDAAPHWDYKEHGPTTWGGLSPAFVDCAEGHSQSPIDIRKAEMSKSSTITTSYKPASLRIVHNLHSADVVNTGHSVQVNIPQGDSLTIGDTTYSLVQFHFHGPSEHTINGKHFPMEMHLVHISADKKLAVVGVLIEEGKGGREFGPIWANLPSTRGVETHVENVTVDVDTLMPRSRAAYRYDGSLTTPPCSEGVKWIVLKEPVSMSAAHITALNRIAGKNNRPVQPLGGRKVFVDVIAGAGAAK